MIAAFSRNTEAGIARRAAERRQALLAASQEPSEPPQAPDEAPKPESEPCKVLPFRRKPVEKPEYRAIISECRHRAFLAAFQPYSRPSGRDIIAMVAAWHGLTAADILGRSRSTPIVEARFDAVCEVYRTARINGGMYTLPALGRLFHRDYSTCYHALHKRGFK
jgi:hypothetical protein